MKLTTERLGQILGSKIDPVATHLAIHDKHVFAERLYRRIHSIADLREILILRKEIEQQQERIAELEKAADDLTKAIESMRGTVVYDQAREIERLRWALDAMVKACSQANLDSKWDQEIQAAIALLNPRANNEH